MPVRRVPKKRRKEEERHQWLHGFVRKLLLRAGQWDRFYAVTDEACRLDFYGQVWRGRFGRFHITLSETARQLRGADELESAVRDEMMKLFEKVGGPFDEETFWELYLPTLNGLHRSDDPLFAFVKQEFEMIAVAFREARTKVIFLMLYNSCMDEGFLTCRIQAGPLLENGRDHFGVEINFHPPEWIHVYDGANRGEPTCARGCT